MKKLPMPYPMDKKIHQKVTEKLGNPVTIHWTETQRPTGMSRSQQLAWGHQGITQMELESVVRDTEVCAAGCYCNPIRKREWK